MTDHGTRASYNRGCRCDECRKAMNAYMREYQARRRRKAADPEFGAIRELVDLLDGLDEPIRQRVLRYVNDRYRP